MAENRSDISKAVTAGSNGPASLPETFNFSGKKLHSLLRSISFTLN